MAKRFHVEGTIEAPTERVWTLLTDACDGSTKFSMTEDFTGPFAGLITKAIPDMTESFNQFADGVKRAAE